MTQTFETPIHRQLWAMRFSDEDAQTIIEVAAILGSDPLDLAVAVAAHGRPGMEELKRIVANVAVAGVVEEGQ